MLPPSFLNFYDNWNAKSDAIDETQLSGVFDKYISLFIIYNSLYTQVPDAFIANGISVPMKIYDNELAIKWVIRFLGADNIVDNLVAHGIQNDINALIGLIQQQRFYIKLNYGARQRNEDLKILLKLRSTNNAQKAVGILEVIYNVRCNLFHGHKDMIEPQRSLLSPLVNILKVLNTQLFSTLNA
jgi:hypothetical protein